MAAKFYPAYCLCSSIKSIDGNSITLTDEATELDLCAKLSATPGTYTNLMLSVGVGYEEFKVTCVGGCLKLSPTPTTEFASGDKVWFESCSAANIQAIQACIAEEAAEESTSTFKIEGFIAQTDPETGQVCWVPDPANTKDPVVFQVGKQVITIDANGCATVEAAEPGSYPEEGVYQYATVTVGQNCQITQIKQGTKPVGGSCGGSCCSCGECTKEVTEAGSV